MRRNTVIGVVFVVCISVLMVGSMFLTGEGAIPAEAKTVYEQYCDCRLDADMEGALEYVLFPPEHSDFYELMMDNDSIWTKCKIKEWHEADSKLYDECYQVTFDVDTKYDGSGRYSNYVCRVDGEWKVVLNEMNI